MIGGYDQMVIGFKECIEGFNNISEDLEYTNELLAKLLETQGITVDLESESKPKKEKKEKSSPSKEGMIGVEKFAEPDRWGVERCSNCSGVFLYRKYLNNRDYCCPYCGEKYTDYNNKYDYLSHEEALKRAEMLKHGR